MSPALHALTAFLAAHPTVAVVVGCALLWLLVLLVMLSWCAAAGRADDASERLASARRPSIALVVARGRWRRGVPAERVHPQLRQAMGARRG